jgi:U3 small nucleolar RNA-associated protein 22
MATRTDGELAIDMMVVMPKGIFQEKDYLNFRYFYKRAYYLACLAAGIQASKEHGFELSFDNLNGNQLQPILVVHPSGLDSTDFSSSKCRINILPIISDDTFPGTKLLPRSNCVRPPTDDNERAQKPLAPTTFYNSTLQSDATATSYLKLLHVTAEKCAAFKDACILGRIWLKQRGFGSSLRKGGFGNFEWAALTALLLQPNSRSGMPPLSPGYSSYQLFKALLQFLARHDLSTKPFIFDSDDISFPRSRLAPVIFDGPRYLNILFKTTAWSYSRLRVEAEITVRMLDDPLFDQFDSTFILRADMASYRYDATLELPLSAFGFDSESDDYDVKLEETCMNVYNSLIRALTDRVTTVTLSIPSRDMWPVSSSNTPESQQKRLLIHFAIDPGNAHRTVDYGPAAENKQEAASFRKFWGEKAELRRFKDGSILESVVWSNKDISASVIEQISLYILELHTGARIVGNAIFTNDPFAKFITCGHVQGQSGTASFMPVMNAFSALERNIRELESLPLQIRHIRAADEQLRYASIEPLLGRPACVVLQFEGSARWPDDLCAIQRTKIALLVKLSELLSTAHSDVLTHVGLENLSQPSQNQAYLDITVRTGLVFRLRIHHDREATLLERQLKDKSLDVQSRDSATTALALYKRNFIHVLSHTQAIQNLCTRYAALSPAIRLTKKWFASHLLSPHFATELIELLVVRTFLQPYPWPTPSCATTGFLRTLAWISRWDWRHMPLVVNFSCTTFSNSTELQITETGKMNIEDMKTMQTRFEAWRQLDPAMNRVVLFAATNIDTDGSTWSDRGKPEKVVAARMTALSKAATVAIRSEEHKMSTVANGKYATRNEFLPELLFVSDTRDYDFVIHISSKYAKDLNDNNSESRFRNLEIQQESNLLQRSEKDFMLFFTEDLHSVFGDTVLWFWNPESVSLIAGLWNPVVTKPRGFKTMAGWNSVPLKGLRVEEDEKKVDIEVNKGAILNEIKRLGGDLICKIELHR